MTDDLDLTRFAEQIPLVTDRILLELANGLTVASAFTAQRSGQGIIARLAAQITGRDQLAQLMTLRNLIDGQQAITDWLVEVTSRNTVSDLALAQVTAHLAQTSRMVADIRARHQLLAGGLQELSEMVADLAQTCARRLDGLESWRTEVTLHMAAERDFKMATERWQEGRSYAELPWPYQVLLLSREVAAGSCGRWDYLHDTEFAPRLADRIVTHLSGRPALAGSASPGGRPPQTPPGRVTSFLLVALFGESSESLPDVRQRQLIAEVLGTGLDAELALPSGPLTSTAAITMELAALPADIQPAQPAHMALELVRRRFGWLDGGTTLSGFIRAVIREQMETASLTWQRLDAVLFGSLTSP